MSEAGIHHQTSCTYTSQHNGVAERKNRHPLALMFSMNVPKFSHGETVLASTYLINRMPSRVYIIRPLNMLYLNAFFIQISYLLCHLKCLEVQHTYLFHSTTFHHRSKLDHMSNKCIVLGYSGTQKGYKSYCHKTEKLFVTLDVTFDKRNELY